MCSVFPCSLIFHLDSVKRCKTKLLVDDVVPGFSQHMFSFHRVIFLFSHIDYINSMHTDCLLIHWKNLRDSKYMLIYFSVKKS